jgi:hypothetical protein
VFTTCTSGGRMFLLASRSAASLRSSSPAAGDPSPPAG